MNTITVVGIGPGGDDYILPAARHAAAAASVLVGGQRAVLPFAGLNKEIIPISGKLEGLAERIREAAQTQKVAVLVSGDPGFYSLLVYLRRYFRDDELEVIPGISSVQVAFARLKLPWQDAALLSVHGRDAKDILPELLSPGKKGVLTDNKWTPQKIAQLLLGHGAKDAKVALCRALTTPDEQIILTHLSELNETAEGDCVMVILDE